MRKCHNFLRKKWWFYNKKSKYDENKIRKNGGEKLWFFWRKKLKYKKVEILWEKLWFYHKNVVILWKILLKYERKIVILWGKSWAMRKKTQILWEKQLIYCENKIEISTRKKLNLWILPSACPHVAERWTAYTNLKQTASPWKEFFKFFRWPK